MVDTEEPVHLQVERPASRPSSPQGQSEHCILAMGLAAMWLGTHCSARETKKVLHFKHGANKVLIWLQLLCSYNRGTFPSHIPSLGPALLICKMKS